MALGEPSYRRLTRSQWQEAIDYFGESHAACRACPRQCGARRSLDERGLCQAGREARIASFGLHHGEEPPISGQRGSGTIFFSGCTLKCLFCQNHSISQECEGKFYTEEQLAGICLDLQEQGAHNINLVTPTPYLYSIVLALAIARDKGLSLPLVYNTGGYDRVESIRRLEGLIDIYMPDLKYGGSAASRDLAERLSGAPDYFTWAFPALEEMFRQSGPLQRDERGVAQRGVLVRHLIIPSHVSNSLEVLDAIAGSLLREADLSLMSQFHPSFHSHEQPDINRRLLSAEFRQVKAHALKLGLTQGWFQEI